MTRALVLVGALAVAAGTAGADDKDAKDKGGAKNDLLGTYTIVSGERDGKKIPAEEVRDSVVTFTRDKVLGVDKDRNEFFSATYTLDATATEPMRIMMTSVKPVAGEKATGLIKVSGDQVTICYNLPGGKAPTDFTAGEKQQCFVLKRIKGRDEK